MPPANARNINHRLAQLISHPAFFRLRASLEAVIIHKTTGVGMQAPVRGHNALLSGTIPNNLLQKFNPLTTHRLLRRGMDYAFSYIAVHLCHAFDLECILHFHSWAFIDIYRST